MNADQRATLIATIATELISKIGVSDVQGIFNTAATEENFWRRHKANGVLGRYLELAKAIVDESIRVSK